MSEAAEVTELSPREIAAQIAKSAATQDLSLFRGVFAEDAIWWHAFGDRVVSVEDSLAYFQLVLNVTENLRYEDVRITETPSGYIDQHYVRANMPDGTQVSMPAVMVVTVENGKVVRLDEYVEAFAGAPITAAIEALQRQ